MSASTRVSHPRKWIILALVLVAECMDLLDGTIVNVAAPTIRTDLHASTAALQWVIGGYALAFAAGLVAGGRLGDIYGRKRLFVIGAIGFVAASTSCAFAVSPGTLIACRLAQGAAAALLIPQGLGILREVFAPEEQGAAFGVFGPVIGLSAVLGPILGGALIAANAFGSGWRLIFFINLPLGLIAAIGAARLMPESRAPSPPRLDYVGTGLAALAMGLLIYPLIQGREAGWPIWTYLMMAGSVVAFGLMVPWSRRMRRLGRDPLIEASVFSHRAYSAGLATIVVFFAGMIGLLLVITLFLQFGEHFSAIHAGLTLAPFALGSAIGATLSAAVLVPRFGRIVLQLAPVLVAAGAWWMHQVIASHGLHTGSLSLVAPQLAVGVGLGLLISPLFDFILASVTDDEVGSASGVLNAVQQLAGAVGVAAIGTFFFSTLTHHGFVVAMDRALVVEIATAPVLILLTSLLPSRAREPEVVTDRQAMLNSDFDPELRSAVPLLVHLAATGDNAALLRLSNLQYAAYTLENGTSTIVGVQGKPRSEPLDIEPEATLCEDERLPWAASDPVDFVDDAAVTPCTATPPLPVDPLPPTSTSALPPSGGLTGDPGRALTGAGLTLRHDVGLWQWASTQIGVVSGTEGGFVAAAPLGRGEGLHLSDTTYVRGLSISGDLLDLVPYDSGTLTVSEGRAAVGKLTLHADGSITGSLGGQPVDVSAAGREQIIVANGLGPVSTLIYPATHPRA